MGNDPIITRIIRQIKRETSLLPVVLRSKFLEIKHADCIMVKAPVIYDSENKIVHHNWGDDMNVFFLEYISGKNVVILPDCRLSKLLRIKNYICIGSTLSFYDVSNSTIWGSGIINSKTGLHIHSAPRQITAVRGPLSRKWLMDQDIKCPDIYGDPILLMPLFYKPVKCCSSRIGIIPHYCDMDNKVIKKFLNNEGVNLISTRGYDRWQEFIDMICGCEIIFSSSLHGLIVAYAYNIPAVWIESDSVEDGWETKFYDFFYSVNIKNVEPCVIFDGITVDMIIEKKIDYSTSYFDEDRLISACPFEIDKSKILSL